MSTQPARAECQQSLRAGLGDVKSERRIVYLKDHPETHANAMCRIECPGFCSCASKQQGA